MAHTNAAAQLLGHLVAKALAISKKFPFCGVEMWRLVRIFAWATGVAVVNGIIY